MLGDAFRAAGADVRYSLEADNDDTMAAYAQLDSAHVLSKDKDFFRSALSW
jgi:predicted nuclease of predicted toxin-antitoxin system